MSEMTIWCPNCDRRLRCPAILLGKQTTCPACKHVFVVRDENQTYGLAPAEEPTSDSDATLDRAANESNRGPAGQPPGDDANRCPSCSGAMLRDAVVCLNCGFDRRTGAHVETHMGVDSPDARGREAASANTPLRVRPGHDGTHLNGLSIFIIAWGILGGAWALLIIARRALSGFDLLQMSIDAAGPLLFIGVCVLWYRQSRRRALRGTGATTLGIVLFICGTVLLIKAAHATILVAYMVHDLSSSLMIYSFVTIAILFASRHLIFGRRALPSNAGVHKCGSCGSSIAPRAVVCVQCGCNQLTGDVASPDTSHRHGRESDSSIVSKCLFCSRPLNTGDDLCMYCGHSRHDLQSLMDELEAEAEARARKEIAACYSGVAMVAGACFIKAGHNPGAAALGAAVALCGALLTHFMYGARIVGPLSRAALRDRLRRQLSSSHSVLAHCALWLAVIPVLNILGTILGITALVRISRSRGCIYGRRRAIAATVISLWFYPVMLGIYAEVA